MSEKYTVKVAVRIRPLNAREADSKVITEVKAQSIYLKSNAEKKKFTFDLTYDQTSTQDQVYNDIGVNIIEQAFLGYNTCVFAYGQTGCFAAGTLIRLYPDGEKAVQCVNIGDKLLGDDLTPRTVLKLFQGIQQLYHVYDKDQFQYTVNEDHILVMKNPSGRILEIPICVYLELKEPRLYCYRSDKSRFIPVIKKANVSNYYGFMLDGNHRFIGARNHILRNSGKTHTMMGNYNDILNSELVVNLNTNNVVDTGIVPRICMHLFSQQETQSIKTKSKSSETNAIDNISYHLELSYFEIYSELVYDLLNPSEHDLKVRQHPELGPYVEGLSRIPVMDFTSIHALLEKGNKYRTTAATKMNARSSRSHAILTLYLTQKHEFTDGTSKEFTSRINLVDLAGSERVASSGVSGVNFQEAININKSLSTLGLVINELACNTTNLDTTNISMVKKSISQSVKHLHVESNIPLKKSSIIKSRSSKLSNISTTSNKPIIISSSNINSLAAVSKIAKPKKIIKHVPFRDSTLTWLLKDSLGGNSKTFMIATISPAMINYSESLSTLGFAHRAKKIVNDVRINEDSNNKLINILQNEIAQLKRSLETGSGDEIQKIRDELQQRELLMKERDKTWEQKLKEHHELEERFRQQEERYLRQEEELNRIKQTDRNIDSSITKSAVNLQQYYDKKVQEIHTDYERKLRDRDEADAKRSLDEINRLKSSNTELKENLAKNQCELQRQMRQFTSDRAMLSKQIQQLHSRITTLERENKQLSNLADKSANDTTLATLTETIRLKTLEYDNISKRKHDEDEKYNKLQDLYKNLALRIESDTKTLDELNIKHNITLEQVAANKLELEQVRSEYIIINEKLIHDKEEYSQLLVKKEELHTELVSFKAALDLYSSKHKITSHDDLTKLRDGFESILASLKSTALSANYKI